MSSGYSAAQLVSSHGFLWTLGAFFDCNWLDNSEEMLEGCIMSRARKLGLVILEDLHCGPAA